MFLYPGRAVQIVYIQHSLQLPGALWKTVLLKLCVSQFLWGSIWSLPCWLLDIQAMLRKLCVTMLRFPGLRALESQTAILLGRIMSTNTCEWIHSAPPWAGFTPLVSLSQTTEHNHPLTAYATICGDMAVRVDGKQCSWQKKVG